jgi:hypothetical protein
MTEPQDSTTEPEVEQSEETAFQRLISDKEQAREMIGDLEDLEGLVPESEDIEDVQGWEIALSFDATDVPYILEELEELVDDEQ